MKLLASTALVLPLSLGASAAFAQTAPAAEVQEVIVTGSRVARTGFMTPTPTTVVSEQLLQQNASNSIASALQSLPAFRATDSQATTGPRAGRTPGAAFANLRGLGSIRTLTLINGRRAVPTSLTGEVDLNIVPSMMVDRVDVVTGGASAAYGSDAVSGVVNVILRNNVQGVEGDVSYGESSHNDNISKRIGLVAGTSFADGRGHVTIGGEYDKNKGIGLAYTRDWGLEGYGVLPNPTISASNPATAANPRFLVVPRYGPSNLYAGGVVTSGPLKGLTFEPNGQTGQFQYGSIVGPSFMSGGPTYIYQYIHTNLQSPSTRKNLAGRVDFDVSDTISVFGEAGWAQSHSVNKGGAPRDTRPLTVRIENPYLPASVVAQMQANNLTTLAVGRYNFDNGFSENDADTKVTRFTLGIEGELPGGWTWDAYGQYGKTKYVQYTRNTRQNAKWFNAIDVVTDPATGNPICRSTLTDPNNGCIPANIFGAGSINPAAFDYINGTEYYSHKYTQKLLGANLRGEPFSTWAGPVSVAAGVERRKEEVTGEADQASIDRLWYVGNQAPLFGDVSVTELFAEAVTPLLADQPFAESLELNTAVRRTDYSTTGGVTTWKLGLNYAVNHQIRFRATRSHDIRAPNLNDIFTQGLTTITPVINTATTVSQIVPQVIAGNPDLVPEEAETTTVGVILRPDFIPGLDISVDYYRIELKDAISSLTAQQIVDGCFEGITSLCSQIVLSGGSTLATGRIEEVNRSQINIASVDTSGWDFEVRYRPPLDAMNIPGDLTLQLYASRLSKLKVDDGTGAIKDYAGEVGSFGAFGGPKWRGTFMANYVVGPVSITGTVRYVGGGKYNNDYGPVDIDDNDVASATYFNLSGEYTLMDRDDGTKVTVYALAQNLFGKDPPIAPGQVWQTNPVYYDMIGKTYKAGIRFAF